LAANDPTLATIYIGTETKFNDVNPNFYAYNAINLCIDKGIFDFPNDGNFNPNGSISGIDAILAIRKFEKIIEMHSCE